MLNRSSADLPMEGSLSKQREPLEVIFPVLAPSHLRDKVLSGSQMSTGQAREEYDVVGYG